MNYQNTDRVLYFEEGIREDVLKKWAISKSEFQKQFHTDFRDEIIPDVEVNPAFKKWPTQDADLEKLKVRLNPADSKRLPNQFNSKAIIWKKRNYPLFLRVHRGFFLTMGVYDNHRFIEVLQLLMENPSFVKQFMMIQGEFAASLVDKIMSKVKVDAVFFSEPIGSNVNSLISPRAYEEIVLESYLPLLKICDKYKIKNRIFLTYANASTLIPSILKFGFNCLWACEVNCEEMNYINLRKRFGKELRLIGGIDLDTLLKNKHSIKKEIMKVVPSLIEQGGYIPLADGRVRSNIPFENYLYYRKLLNEIIQGN